MSEIKNVRAVPTLAFDGETVTVTHLCGCVAWIDVADVKAVLSGEGLEADWEAGINYCEDHTAVGRVEVRREWTEQQERLLRAAQDVVNEAERVSRAYDVNGDEIGDRFPANASVVDQDVLDALAAIVQEISDDAVKAIQAAAKEPR